jgi:hypothetical protein
MRFIGGTLCRLRWLRKRPFGRRNGQHRPRRSTARSVINRSARSTSIEGTVPQPTKFELVIISSRETLDVKISDNLLSLAHEVMER